MVEVLDVRLEPSPRRRDHVRLAATVAYDDAANDSEVYWFEVPEVFGDALDTSGNAWAVGLLPLAAQLGAPLRLHQPLDPTLRANLGQVLTIWRSWYPRLHGVTITAPEGAAVAGPQRTFAFFSGGVDSFYTVLRHQPAAATPVAPYADDAVCVWGFDIPITEAAAFARLQERLARTATELGLHFVPVATNLRTTRVGRVPWGALYHGSALAMVAHALGRRYDQALIASTGGYHDLKPWGSHVLTDPLLSSGGLRIIHDGAEATRAAKTAFVAQSPAGLRSLHVCWVQRSDDNCCTCSKCLRTMMTLELFGRLQEAQAFTTHACDLRRIGRLFLPQYYDTHYWAEIGALAGERGRLDVVRAVRRSMRYSRCLRPVLRVAQWMSRRRGLWRLGIPLEARLRAMAR